jgi:hypothetical protein
MTVERMLTGLMRSAGILSLLTATVFTVMSCSGSDDTPAPNPPVPPQPNMEIPIAFSGNLSEGKSENHGRTRVGLETVWTDDADKKFKVWTVKNSDYSDPNYTSPQFVMWNYNVKWVSGSAGTTTSNTHDWEYVNQQESGVEQSIKYWDYDAKAYRFFGFAGIPVTVSPASPASTTESVIMSFTAPAATNPQSDPMTLPATPYYSKLWFSNGNLTAYPNRQFGQPVQLEFLKPYVKVRFMFRQSDASNTNISLSEKSFKPTPADPPAEAKTIATAGTFTVTYPLTGTATEESWSVTGTSSLTEFAQDYYEAASDETDETVLAGQKKWYVVLPAVNQGTYTLSVKVNSETKTVVVPAGYMNWQPGYEYTYIFKIIDGATPALYDVLVGFAQWNESVSSYTVYNW